MTVLAGARVVTPAGVVDPGWVELDGDRIAAVGAGAPPRRAVDLAGAWLLPGFVDVHVHGGGGDTVTAGDPDAAARAVAFHRAHGTTTTLLSLVTAPADHLLAAVASLAGLVEEGVAAGLHLEGPFLAAARCGAQEPRWMVDPDPALADALLAAARGTVRVVTVAPERPGALDLVRRLAGAGAVVAVGHTDATHDEAAAAFAAGATLATHLGNGMRPFHHREPGAVGATLDDRRAVAEVIADGTHLHPAVVRAFVAALGPDRVALITDAMAAAGRADGTYELGGRSVVVDGGVARIADTGALAGSTLTMAEAVRRIVGFGIPLADASRMASLVPARVLGLDGELGAVAPGRRADLVVLDDGLAVVAVLAAGEVLHGGF